MAYSPSFLLVEFQALYILGYDVSKDLMFMMEDYCNLHRQFSRGLISYFERWSKRIQHQNTLCSYNTTKRAVLDTVKSAKQLAFVEDKRIQNIQHVIDKYKTIVNDTYIPTRFSFQQHRRTKEFKKQFKEAYQMLNDCKIKLDNLKNDYKIAQEDLKKADSAHEIVFSDSTTTDKQRTRAIEMQTKRRRSLKKISGRIAVIENNYNHAKKVYCRRVKVIFQDCQQEEEHRLDLIKETLLDFCQAIQTENQIELDKVYENLAYQIQTKQNSLDDIIYWAQSYGAIDYNTDPIRDDSKTSKVRKQHIFVEESPTINSKSLIEAKKMDTKVYESIVTTLGADDEDISETRITRMRKTDKESNSKKFSTTTEIDFY
ncbi:unnamed protein product [Didymodactylos carnosus]|uniref:F-BAR domain-containing protein n=1 Tax=Didymodactylos carnosus TaxID=1234261 RepID=A0A814A4Z7_9BILA|nr:unnamed protein product [Didymodactylos carnosus]CAF1013434.1 unnamed protein product [Didymodactylos carnosus]CAF3690490.1 unnamed protein product [Didymodactylos carnosus]CAF3782397.1 unnamed protein product [Didymodactylos carnosus]